MAGESEVLFSLSGRLHVILRRATNRIIDVEWLAINGEYARAVIELARDADTAELNELADRIEEIHPLLARQIKPVATHIPPAPAEQQEDKYLFSLR
ncbi:MAG: hypothetical protein PHY62_07955 [Gallionella sp.]|jgi:hypothetical protein|nr:hypothetical protein [Gallionella sp.]